MRNRRAPVDEHNYRGGAGAGASRFRNPGKSSLNRALAALAVAAVGYALGFAIVALSHQGSMTSGGGLAFFPIGGLFALFLAVIAIQIGRKTRMFIDGLDAARRERIGAFIDLELERKRATAGMVVGVIAILANPLVGFLVIVLVRR
jgi:hypothetical protein